MATFNFHQLEYWKHRALNDPFMISFSNWRVSTLSYISSFIVFKQKEVVSWRYNNFKFFRNNCLVCKNCKTNYYFSPLKCLNGCEDSVVSLSIVTQSHIQRQKIITKVKRHQQQMQTEINSIFENMSLWEPMLVDVIIDYVLKNDFEKNIFI